MKHMNERQFHDQRNILAKKDVQDYIQFINPTKSHNIKGLHKLFLIQDTNCWGPSEFCQSCAPSGISF